MKIKCPKCGNVFEVKTNKSQEKQNNIIPLKNTAIAGVAGMAFGGPIVSALAIAATSGVEKIKETLQNKKQQSPDTFSCPVCGNGWAAPKKENFYMRVEDVFIIEDRGIVVTGRVETGCISVGDNVLVTKKNNKGNIQATVTGIEMFRKLCDYAEFGDNIGLFFKGIDLQNGISKGDMVIYCNNNKTDTAQKDTDTVSLQQSVTNEQEYIDEYKFYLEDDGEITEKDRRMLERRREKLGISKERAQELEASLSSPQLKPDEQEYLDEYKCYLEDDGKITEKDRRMLERRREKLGITQRRAQELEALCSGTNLQKHKIFISYSRKDSIKAGKICEILKGADIDYWIDVDGTYSGSNYKEIITKEIKNSTIVLFISSKNSNQSDNVVKEIGIADGQKKMIIPVKIDDCKFSDAILYDLGSIDSMEYNESTFPSKLIDRINNI